MPTKAELLKENAELKEALRKERSKERCYKCGGSGKFWTYGLDNEIDCPACNGRGVC